MWNLKDGIKSLFNVMNRCRLAIVTVPSATIVLGVLRNHVFLLGFGIGFVIASLMIATIALKYG